MKQSRRTILKSFAALGAVSVGNIKINKVQAHPCDLPVRRSVAELDLDDPILETYREFVTIMKEKPDSDPVSWEGLTSIHGTETGGFNFCPHGSWYFLPWHRAYLHMYEVMCRDITGNQDFAMPYWDWTEDRQLPRAFTDQTWQGNPNPLFDSTRTVDPTASLSDFIVGKTQVMDPIYAETNFELFGSSRSPGQDSLDQSWITRGGGAQGPLEGNPHNRVHCWIGGQMCSAVSPRDPIFSLHHGNIDHVWAEWNHRGHSNTTDSLWLDMEFQANFIAPDGTTYTKTVKDLQDYEQLGYSYELSPVLESLNTVDDSQRNQNLNTLFAAAAGLESVGLQSASQSNDKAATTQNPLSVPLKLDESVISMVAGDAGLETVGRTPEILALIKNIMPPNDGNTDVRVFVNCDYLSQDVPITDPHYVTNFGFFGSHDTHGSGKALPSVAINLTSALKKLARAKLLTGDTITVQLLPVAEAGTAADASDIVPAEIEIVVI